LPDSFWRVSKKESHAYFHYSKPAGHNQAAAEIFRQSKTPIPDIKDVPEWAFKIIAQEDNPSGAEPLDQFWLAADFDKVSSLVTVSSTSSWPPCGDTRLQNIVAL